MLPARDYAVKVLAWEGAIARIAMSASMIFCEVYRLLRGVIAIVVGNGHGDTSSNPGRG